MARFVAWLSIAVAAAFLAVATLSFSVSAAVWLTFGVSVGALAVALGISYCDRRHIYAVVTGLATAALSIWTIVASLVLAPSTAQVLGFASALGLAGLAIVGLAVHEFATERALSYSLKHSGQPEPGLAAA